MKPNESQAEISWINDRPIPKGEPSDSVFVGWIIVALIISGIVTALFGGKNCD
jgi:hypothetical protein